jgi:hypothetical protein
MRRDREGRDSHRTIAGQHHSTRRIVAADFRGSRYSESTRAIAGSGRLADRSEQRALRLHPTDGFGDVPLRPNRTPASVVLRS